MAKRDKRPATPAGPPERAEPAETPPAPAFQPWRPPLGLSRRGWAVLAGFLLLINVPVLHRMLRGPLETTVQVPFADDFSGAAPLAERYFSTGGGGQLRGGLLVSPGVRNNALWLKAALPQDVKVTLQTRTSAPEADIRVEIFGNGEDILSGYRLVLAPAGTAVRGTLYRLGENGASWSELRSRPGAYSANTPVRVDGATLPLRNTEAQRWVIERRGQTLRWTVNGLLVLEFTDPFPLTGRWHDRLGLSSNELDVLYDRLEVTPAPGTPFPPATAAASPAGPPPGPFADDFDRAALGTDWQPTDPGSVKLEGGALMMEKGHNHPLWLTHPLPDNAVIELDAWSDSPDGDLKVEAWGDGVSSHQGDLGAAYRASGYVFVMGGWRNSRSVLARREEHGSDVAERSDVKVEPGRHYRWRITRRGGHLVWEVDGAPFLTLDDPAPLAGPGQDHFAFSDWETRVHFDNFKMIPLN